MPGSWLMPPAAFPQGAQGAQGALPLLLRTEGSAAALAAQPAGAIPGKQGHLSMGSAAARGAEG